MTNVHLLRPKPAFSSYSGRPGMYYAEADGTALGLWVERDRRCWRFEVITTADEIVANGLVRTLREAKSVLAAVATRLIG